MFSINSRFSNSFRFNSFMAILVNYIFSPFNHLNVSILILQYPSIFTKSQSEGAAAFLFFSPTIIQLFYHKPIAAIPESILQSITAVKTPITQLLASVLQLITEFLLFATVNLIPTILSTPTPEIQLGILLPHEK